MHEATRKVLGVLLREMDGFEASRKSIIIGAHSHVKQQSAVSNIKPD